MTWREWDGMADGGGLDALFGVQFFDYTKAPLHEQLAAADLNPKYHVFFETVGFIDPTLFVRSPAYLAPGGVFISVGPQGKGISNFVNFAWKVFLQPSFLGGTKRKWRLIGVKPNKKDWEAFTKLVQEGACYVLCARVELR